MLQEIQERKPNQDGADQGLLTAYFTDLLDKPLFHPPTDGSRLDGLYRLPLGYQMDASYFCKYHPFSLSMLCFFCEKALKTLYVLEEALAMKVYTCGMIWLSLQAVFMEALS